MISLKISLAFVITFVIAIIAFFIASSNISTDIKSVLPSIFIALTTVLFVIVSKLQKTNSTSSSSDASQPQDGTTAKLSTLYVGNLAYKANEKTVQDHFETVGTVKSVRLVKDKRTGRRKGFGFVEINAGDEQKFIKKLNESEFMERSIIVRTANEKQH